MWARFAVGILAVGLATPSLADRKTASPATLDVPEMGTFATRTPDRDSIRVLSWNIDRGYHADRVSATLSAQQPDVCLLQEVDRSDRRTRGRNVAAGLAKQLGYNYAFGAEFEELSQSIDGQPAYHGQATLTRWPIVAARVLRFQKQSSWWQPHSWIPDTAFFQRRIGGRIALVTELRYNDQRVIVYNLHLESRSGGAIQWAQLEEVFADLAKYPADTASIIGGDFNSKYHPYELLHSMEQHGLLSVLGERVQRTHVIIGYLDWVFFRAPWRLQSGEVLRETHASDHDPVIGTFVSQERVPASQR